MTYSNLSAVQEWGSIKRFLWYNLGAMSARVAIKQAQSCLVEYLDDVCHEIGEQVERGNNWFALDETSFIDRYVRNELHFVIRPLADETEYGFLIYAQPTCGGMNGDEIGRQRFTPRHRQPKGSHFDTDQSAVLANNVELMERPQRLVASVIRLQRFNEAPLKIGQP